MNFIEREFLDFYIVFVRYNFRLERTVILVPSCVTDNKMSITRILTVAAKKVLICLLPAGWWVVTKIRKRDRATICQTIGHSTIKLKIPFHAFRSLRQV